MPPSDGVRVRENVMNDDGFSGYLTRLSERMRTHEVEAFKEFAGLFGPAFREWFLSKGISDSDAEELSVRSIWNAASLLAVEPWREAAQVGIAVKTVLHSTLAEHWSHLQAIGADLLAAADLQAKLLPMESPAIAGLDIAVRFRPARVVTGDLFGVFDPGDNSALLVLGDASGKGAAAALYSALLLGALRAKAAQLLPLPKLMRDLSDLLYEHKVDWRYVTLIAAHWNRKAQSMSFCCAGAASPILLRRGAATVLKMEGFPLGLYPAVEYEVETVGIEPGDAVVLYSDGVVDQEGDGSDVFGEHRLLEFLGHSSSLSATELAEGVLAELSVFAGKKPVFDDQTVVVIRVPMATEQGATVLN